MNKKEAVIWFVKMDNMESWIVSAKLKQLHEWINDNRPFGDDINLVIVPSDENKISFLRAEKDIREDFHGDFDDWLYNIKGTLEDCLSVNLQYKKE